MAGLMCSDREIDNARSWLKGASEVMVASNPGNREGRIHSGSLPNIVGEEGIR